MLKKLAIIIGLVALVAVVGAAAMVGWVYWRMAGRPDRPLPTGPVIVEARLKARQGVAHALRELDTICPPAGFTCYDTATLDYCEMGEHNFAVNSHFDNRCRYVETRYYGLTGDFRSRMAQLDSAITTWGWASHRGLRSVLRQYYDRWHGPGKPKPMNLPHEYLVSDMPGVSYQRDHYLLTIRYAEANSSGQPPTRIIQPMPPFDLSYREGHEIDAHAEYAKILAKEPYVVAIDVIADDYFVN